MGLFDKLKSIISKKSQESKINEDVQKYDEGLEKTRKVSKTALSRAEVEIFPNPLNSS